MFFFFLRPAFKNLSLILTISDWIWGNFFSSEELTINYIPLITEWYYRGSVNWIHRFFNKNFLIQLFFLIIWVSKNILGLCSNVNFMLGWYEFNASKMSICFVTFSFNIRVVHIKLVKYRFQRFYYVPIHFVHVNIWEYHWYGTSHWESINLSVLSIIF